MENRETSLRLSQGTQKLIPRDISQSLGKLPPQAIDLEEAVLGALMLEVKSIEKVPFLKPQHFYDNRHEEIFRAIKQLADAGVMPDMRMVVSHLRTLGKIEIIGGAYYIAELTSKVSSSQNIHPQARVIVEMAMKRNLIQIASQIHHQAYEETTDVFALIQEVQNDVKFLEERETESSGPERIKALWEETMVIEKPDVPPPFIMLGETPIAAPGDHTLIIGKKKSRKSLLVTYLISLFLRDRQHTAEEVLIFDTEQGKSHVWKARDRIYRMTNQYVAFFYLRGRSPQDRMDFIWMTVLYWSTHGKKKPKIVVIDGIRDLMRDINSTAESTDLIVWLERLTMEFQISVIDILHINKTDNNARGHIGTELLNKTIATLEVVYDNQSGFSQVKCESAREKEFDPFMFTHGPTGLPEMLGVPAGDGAVDQDKQLRLLEQIFEGESLKRKEFEEKVQSHFAIGKGKAKQLMVQFIQRGWVIKSGKDRDPNTSFKLLVQPGFKHPSLTQSDFNSVDRVDFANSTDPVQVDIQAYLPF